MKGIVNRAVFSIVGLLLTLGYWSFSSSTAGVKFQSGIPSKIFEGGQAKLGIEVTTSTPGYLSITYSKREEDDQSSEAKEEVGIGTHRWSIDVPARTGGYIEFGAANPEPGDTLGWTITVNGNEVDSQADTLEEELKPNHAFFLQSYFEDYSTGEFGDD